MPFKISHNILYTTKASAFWLVSNYREAYKLFVCSGILFNHESPLRPSRFVTKKIVSTARRIFQGSNEKLVLGNMNIVRDWGWAPEYVEAMWLMLQQREPDDFVISSGKANSLQSFAEKVFEYYQLDFGKFVTSDSNLMRPTDITYSCGDATKANKILGWHAKSTMIDVVNAMCDAENKKGNLS